MTKFGVGVGEEFPVDEENRSEQEAGSEGRSHRCGRGDRGAGHDAWHQFRDQMRAEWRARRRAFHDSMGRHHDGEGMDDLRAHHMHRLVIGGLALVGLAALLSLFHSRR
ncbi:MAG: hypothetical protein P4L57_01825 [Rhizomicrobium sp.]|nr:hypothetical protein [Rhizomicrobium sp.]